MSKSMSIVDGNEAASSVAHRGSMSHGAVADPNAFERGNYMKVLSSYTLRANAFNDQQRSPATTVPGFEVVFS